MTYLTSRNILNESTEAVCDDVNAMMAALSELDFTDKAAVKAFTEEYRPVVAEAAVAIAGIAKDIKEDPELYCLTDEEAAELSGILSDAADTVRTLFLEDFSYELAKHDDIWKAFALYMTISSRVAKDTQGFDIFKTADGEKWEVVTRDGFGDKFNYGALRFVTTDEGMYITTANPFYGTQLYLLSNDKGEQEEIVPGDADGDGDVTIIDATFVQYHLASIKIFAIFERAADADGDKVVTSVDVTLIQRWIARLIFVK